MDKVRSRTAGSLLLIQDRSGYAGTPMTAFTTGTQTIYTMTRYPGIRQIISLLGMLSMLLAKANAQDIFISRNASISFYSSAPIEDIQAKTEKAVSALNISSKAIYFKVGINTFKFPKSLMQEHFNEDYLESDKYPYSEFKGKIVDDVDLHQDGHYEVTVQGDLTIHNVTKNYTTKGSIDVRGGKITSHSVFNVGLADHNIKIPRIVVKNIAEVVQVTVDADYLPNNGNS